MYIYTYSNRVPTQVSISESIGIAINTLTIPSSEEVDLPDAATPDPQPSTLDPKPSTPDPQPQTLNPKH